LRKNCIEERMREIKRLQEISQVPMAHTCNSSYSGSRDQEVLGSKPVWANRANSSQDPFSKIPITKKAGGMA
jgi:hypothetical protein